MSGSVEALWEGVRDLAQRVRALPDEDLLALVLRQPPPSTLPPAVKVHAAGALAGLPIVQRLEDAVARARPKATPSASKPAPLRPPKGDDGELPSRAEGREALLERIRADFKEAFTLAEVAERYSLTTQGAARRLNGLCRAGLVVQLERHRYLASGTKGAARQSASPRPRSKATAADADDEAPPRPPQHQTEPVRLRVVRPEQVEHATDAFRCEPYSAVLSAATCVRRQDAAQLAVAQRGAGSPKGAAAREHLKRGDYGLCRECGVGADVRRRVA